MDNRKQSRLAILFAAIAIIVFLISIFSVLNEKPEVLISPYSDLYQSSYESQIFEAIPSEEAYDAQPRKLKYINIHCTASTIDLSKQWLLNFFKYTRKWSKPGYNLVVHFDGSVDTLVAYDLDGYVQWGEVSYGVKGKNSESINVAYTGGIDKRGNPKDTRTIHQKRALEDIVSTLKAQFPGVQVYGHRDHGAKKACPSFDAKTEYRDIISSNFELFDSPKDSL